MTYRNRVRKALNEIIDDIMAIEDTTKRHKALESTIDTIVDIANESMEEHGELLASTNNKLNKERI